MNKFENLFNGNDKKSDSLDKNPESLLSPQRQIENLRANMKLVSEKLVKLRSEMSQITEDDFKSPQGYVVEKNFEIEDAEHELEILTQRVANIEAMSKNYNELADNLNSPASKN